jgi:hypothetical protein
MKVENMRINGDAYVFASTGKIAAVTTTKEFKSKLFKEQDFNQSLIESIEHSKIFSVKPDGADYQITATLVHWFQPPAGFDFHTDLRVKYIIKRQNDILFQKEIESHSVATVKEAFVGMKRSIMSYERAVKQNIELFINEISKIKF